MLKIHKIPKDYPGPGIHQSTSMPTLPEQKDMSKPGPGFFVQDPGAYRAYHTSHADTAFSCCLYVFGI
eukprot:628942-Amorphochlora_amoeboformis.AAC.1